MLKFHYQGLKTRPFIIRLQTFDLQGQGLNIAIVSTRWLYYNIEYNVFIIVYNDYLSKF
jgi:hypothetical protein